MEIETVDYGTYSVALVKKLKDTNIILIETLSGSDFITLYISELEQLVEVAKGLKERR